MRALAHPLRHALLGQLMTVGPQTPGQCANALDDTAANCDWHLRYLARYGLVEPAGPDPADGPHDRLWCATITGFWDGSDDGPTERAASTAVLLAQLTEADRLAREHVARRYRLPPGWRAVDAISDYGLRLTATETKQLLAAIDALVLPFIAPTRPDPPVEAELVHLSLRAVLRSAGGADDLPPTGPVAPKGPTA
jgi:hypothetical protein